MWFSLGQFRIRVQTKPVNSIHMVRQTGWLQQLCWLTWSIFSTMNAKRLEPAGECLSNKMCLCYFKTLV